MEAPQKGRRRAMAQKVGRMGRAAGWVGVGGGEAAGLPALPGGEPEEGAESDGEEGSAPAEVGHEEATSKGADGGAPADGGDEEAVGEAAILFLDAFAEDFGTGGEDDGFADAEEEAHGEEGGESAGEAGEGGGGGPGEESGGEDGAGLEAVDEPAYGDLEEDVGPEEGGGRMPRWEVERPQSLARRGAARARLPRST